MEEWKELKIDKIPEDFFTGNYEVEVRDIDEELHWSESIDYADKEFGAVLDCLNNSLIYRYRPKAPSQAKEHAERVKAARRVFGLDSNEHTEAVSDAVVYFLSKYNDS